MASACNFIFILNIVQINADFVGPCSPPFPLNWDRSRVGHKHTYFYVATTDSTKSAARDDLNQCCYVLRCTKDTWMIQETLTMLGWRQWLLISTMTPEKFSANSNYRSVKKRARVKYIN